jgi:hypothetical protein
VVANRNPRPVTARLSMTLVPTTEEARTVTLTAPGGTEERVRVRPDRPAEAEIEVPVEADGTVVVAINPGPVEAPPEVLPPPLVAVTELDVAG